MFYVCVAGKEVRARKCAKSADFVHKSESRANGVLALDGSPGRSDASMMHDSLSYEAVKSGKGTDFSVVLLEHPV